MKFEFDKSDLRPLIAQVVEEVLERVEGENQMLGDRIAFPEAEAAALIGVARHVLRDARLRGELSGKKVGNKIVIERDELFRFLRSR